MPRIYHGKDLNEQYRLDRIKLDQILMQFVNQREALDALNSFLKLYLNGTRTPIINIVGKAGYGKTWLLKYFIETSLRDAGVKYIFVNVDELSDSILLLDTIAEVMSSKYDIQLPKYNLVMKELKVKIIDDFEKKEGIGEDSDSEMSLPNQIDVSNVLKSIREIMKDDLSNIININNEIIDLTKITTDNLYEYLPLILASDIENALRESNDRIVLILDSYNMGMKKEHLIPIFLASLTRAFVIISSREKINWSKYSKVWSDPSIFLTIELQPLQASDIDKYAEGRLGISTEDFVNNMISLTKGRPLLLGMLFDYLEIIADKGMDPLEHTDNLLENKGDTPNEQFIVSKLIEVLTPNERNLLEQLSVLDWFDIEFITALTEEERSSLKDSIIMYSLIEPKRELEDAWKIHDVARKLITTLIKSDTALSEKLAPLKTYLSSKIESDSNIHYSLQYLDILEKLSEKTYFETLSNLVDSLYYSIQPSQAKYVYNWLTKKDEESHLKGILLGRLLEVVGLNDDALSLYTNVSDSTNALEEHRVWARREKAKMYFLRNAYSDVVSIIRVNLEKINSQELNERNLIEKFWNYYLLGKAYYLSGKYDKAIETFEFIKNELQDIFSAGFSILSEKNRNLALKLYGRTLSFYLKSFVKTNELPTPDIVNELLSIYKQLITSDTEDILVKRELTRILLDLVEKGLLGHANLTLDNISSIANEVRQSVQKISTDDYKLLILLSSLYQKIGDHYAKIEDFENAYYHYKQAYDLIDENIDLFQTPLMIKEYSSISHKLARTLLYRKEPKQAFEMLLKARDYLEMLIKNIGEQPILLIDYFYILRLLGKIHYRSGRYERAIETIEKAKKIAYSILSSPYNQKIDIFSIADNLKDLFRSKMRARKYDDALLTISELRDFYINHILVDTVWANFETVRILLKVLKEIKNNLNNIAGNVLEEISKNLGDIHNQLLSKITKSKIIPEKSTDYVRILAWLTVNFAKLWYSLSMFDTLYSMIQNALIALDTLYEIADEELKIEILIQKYKILLRRAIAKFFSEFDVEQVSQDIEECRKILGELENKYDKTELAYMKCDLVLFDARVKNSLKNFNQSLINLEDFISIINAIMTEKTDEIRMKELFDRAFKVLRDIRVLTKGKLETELKSTIRELEKDLKELYHTIFKS